MELLLKERTKHMWHSLQMNKMSWYQDNDIEVLSERLKSLKITNKTSWSTNKQTDIEMSLPIAMQGNNR